LIGKKTFVFSGYQNGSSAMVNDMTTSPARSGRRPCVFHTDTSGQVESFSVAATGALTSVSVITVGFNDSPGSILASADGKEVYVAAGFAPPNPSLLDVFTASTNCSLTLASSLEAPQKSYASLALVGSSQLMAIDYANSTIDMDQITKGIDVL
jgi:hypothetical protein